MRSIFKKIWDEYLRKIHKVSESGLNKYLQANVFYKKFKTIGCIKDEIEYLHKGMEVSSNQELLEALDQHAGFLIPYIVKMFIEEFLEMNLDPKYMI